jgi:hypothetical protein
VATAALACALYLPRRFGGRGVAIAAVVAGASYLAHTSNALLFPGLALATFHAWRAADEPPRPVAAGLRAASSLAVALVLAVGVADVVRRGAGVPFRTGGIPEFLADFDVRDLGVLTELLALSGVLLAAAALALAGKRLAAHLAWTCAVLVLPYLFLIWWFGRTERGGYLVATIPVLALAGAGSFGANRVVRGCLWLALAGQVLLGVRALEETRGVVNPDERAERRDLVAHALPDGGVLVSFDPTRQTVQADLPGVREVNLQGVLGSAAKRGVPPAEFVAQVTAAIAELLSTDPGRVALDASYRGWVGAAPALAAYTELLDEEVSRSFRTEELASGRWVIVELSPR